MNIDIGNNYALSVEQDTDKGVSIILTKDGEMLQDIVVVERVKGKILDDAVAVYVWSNEQDESYTHRITIPFFKPEEGEDESAKTQQIDRKTTGKTVRESVDGNAVDDAIETHGNEYLSDEGYEHDYYPMDDIDELLSGKGVTDILLMAYNGKEYSPANGSAGPFNPNSEYFAFDGYGNLMSISKYGLKNYLNEYIDRDEFIDWAIERGYLEDEDGEEEGDSDEGEEVQISEP